MDVGDSEKRNPTLDRLMENQLVFHQGYLPEAEDTGGWCSSCCRRVSS